MSLPLVQMEENLSDYTRKGYANRQWIYAGNLTSIAASGGPAIDGDAMIWTTPVLPVGRTFEHSVEFYCNLPTPSAWLRIQTTAGELSSEVVKDATIRITPDPNAPAETRPSPSAPAKPQIPRPARVTGKLIVDMANTPGYVQVGDKLIYLVRIVNQRNVSDQNVTLTLTMPPGLEFVRLISGPVRGFRALDQEGRRIQFTTIRELRTSRQENLAPFRIEVRALRVGVHDVRARVVSKLSPEGVSTVEDTEVTRAVQP